MGSPLKPLGIVIGRENLHKGFLHAVVEKGGELGFEGLPFKIIFEPVGDSFVRISLLATGKRHNRSRCFNIQRPKPKKEEIPKTVVDGEVEI